MIKTIVKYKWKVDLIIFVLHINLSPVLLKDDVRLFIRIFMKSTSNNKDDKLYFINIL